MSPPEHVTLACEAQGAGLVVTLMAPALVVDKFDVELWAPGGVWMEGSGVSAAMIRARIAHWPAHRQAVAERGGLRLVGSGPVLACGCPTNTNDTTEEDVEQHGRWGHCRDPHCKPCTDAWGKLGRGSHYSQEES